MKLLVDAEGIVGRKKKREGNAGRFPFDQKFRCEFPDISMGEWYRLFQCGKRQAAQFCSLRIFHWLRGLNRKYRSKQNTYMSNSWLFIDHNSMDLIQTTTAAKKSQNKGSNESYNGFTRLINLCTLLSQPMQNKQVHHRGIIFIKRFLHEFSCC